MLKNKPKTIVDLKINWTFDFKYKEITVFDRKFKKLNPDIFHLMIKPADYKFYFKDKTYKVPIVKSVPLGWLMDYIDTLILDLQAVSLKLIKFELLEENVFRIHTKE